MSNVILDAKPVQELTLTVLLVHQIISYTILLVFRRVLQELFLILFKKPVYHVIYLVNNVI